LKLTLLKEFRKLEIESAISDLPLRVSPLAERASTLLVKSLTDLTGFFSLKALLKKDKTTFLFASVSLMICGLWRIQPDKRIAKGIKSKRVFIKSNLNC
jgi:hypothetical protein